MPFPLFFKRFLTFGRRSEIDAIDHLRSLGFKIVTSGYRAKSGEVDVIAWEGNVLVFVEVKAWDPLESTCRHASLSIL